MDFTLWRFSAIFSHFLSSFSQINTFLLPLPRFSCTYTTFSACVSPVSRFPRSFSLVLSYRFSFSVLGFIFYLGSLPTHHIFSASSGLFFLTCWTFMQCALFLPALGFLYTCSAISHLLLLYFAMPALHTVIHLWRNSGSLSPRFALPAGVVPLTACLGLSIFHLSPGNFLSFLDMPPPFTCTTLTVCSFSHLGGGLWVPGFCTPG